jgi:two-component system, NarL family, nitrate/nitrite response regulator NarL
MQCADCGLRTVAIVDADPIFRDNVAKALLEARCFEVIAQGASRSDAMAIAEQHLPDLIILDLAIAGGGIEAASEILRIYPAIRILVLTSSEAESDVICSLQVGALGYVLKGVFSSDLINTAKAVCRGETIVAPSLAGRLLTSMHKRKVAKGSANDFRELTAREHEILEFVGQGKTNKEVGKELQIAEDTVKHYMTNILIKLGVRNRIEAVSTRALP